MEAAGSAPRSMRTFVIIWLGELISLIGSGLTSFALGVWIYQQTGQATPFALTVLFASLPRMLLLPLAGMLADRWNRRWLMILADTGSALVTLGVAVLVMFGRLEIWTIYLLVSLSSACGAFQEPAYRASITMLVPRKDLARSSGMMNASEAAQLLIAPLLAGLLFSLIGLPGILLIDFATYFFALGALLFVCIPQPVMAAEERAQKASLRRDSAFAWRYLRARPGLFWILWYFALVNFLLGIVGVLLGPLVLSMASAEVYGLVEMIFGVGLLAGSVLMGVWGGPKRLAAGLVGFIGLFSLGLMVSGLRPSPWLVGIGMFMTMFCVPLAQGCSTALSQAKIEPSVQGRLFAMRSLIGGSMTPLAYLSAGPLADRVFGPLLLPGGALSAGLVGQILGVGAGRGVGLLFVLAGLLLAVVSAAAWSYPRIRNVEDELPDVVPQVEEVAAQPAFS